MYRLLVVDDEPMIREVIREYAEFNDFEVEEAADGMEAVSKCRENDYDILVMDIMMPRLDGFSACKEIRKYKALLDEGIISEDEFEAKKKELLGL